MGNATEVDVQIGNTIRERREKLGLTQEQFWSEVGVTQSAGCRYELGQPIPKPTAIALELRYSKAPIRALARIRNTTIEALIEGDK